MYIYMSFRSNLQKMLSLTKEFRVGNIKRIGGEIII